MLQQLLPVDLVVLLQDHVGDVGTVEAMVVLDEDLRMRDSAISCSTSE